MIVLRRPSICIRSMNSKITSKLIKKKSTNNILWLDGIHRKKRKAKIVIMIKRCWVSMSLRTV